MSSVIEQLKYIYNNYEKWDTIKLVGDELNEYFERQLINGNILTYVKDGELRGYLNFWCINNEQLGRLMCGITLAHNENLLDGNIALISRMWVNPEDRNGEAFSMLAAMFLSRNKQCTHYAAFQQHKKHKPFQCYTREEIIKHFK